MCEITEVKHMFIFAREWITWIDQLVVNNSIIRCCISLILVLCTTMPNMFQQPQEQASKQPTLTCVGRISRICLMSNVQDSWGGNPAAHKHEAMRNLRETGSACKHRRVQLVQLKTYYMYKIEFFG
jgi:hypothetical protein